MRPGQKMAGMPMTKSKFDLILYDLDGTLQDSIPLILESFHAAYEAVFGSSTRTDEDFMSYIGRPLTDTFEMHDEKTAKLLAVSYLAHNLAEMEKGRVPLFEGIEDMLEKIRDLGVKQGIVTSKLKSSALKTIEPLGLDKFMDVMIFREDTERAKPYGDPLVCAAKKLGIGDMGRVLYVGDAVHDIMSAKDCGASSAVVSWTKMPMEDIDNLGPDFKIGAPSDLPCIIRAPEL